MVLPNLYTLLMLDYPEHPAKVHEGHRCNSLLRTCQTRNCDYVFQNTEETECPYCKRPRERCRKLLKHPRRKTCKLHGGRRVLAIAQYSEGKTGIASKYLPARILATFNEAMEDPDLLNSTEDIALMKARVQDLLSRLEGNIPPSEIWFQLADRFKKYRQKEEQIATAANKSLAQRAMRDARAILSDIETMVRDGYFSEKVWDEVKDVQKHLQFLKDSERRRRKEAEELITQEQFKKLAAYIIKIGREEIKTPEDLYHFEDRMQNLLIGGRDA